VEHREGDRGFGFKSVWERMLPLNKSQCRNCTRPAEPGGRLCPACAINARHDPSIGKYPTVAAVLLVSALAAVLAVPFAIAGEDAPERPAAAPAATEVAEQDVELFPEPNVTVETEYSAPEARSALTDDVIETAASEAAFITTLNANDVGFSTKANAIGIGRSICAVVRDDITAGRSAEYGMIHAEAILTGEDFSDNDAAAYVGAAVGALC
jgi:hypothetical protein